MLTIRTEISCRVDFGTSKEVALSRKRYVFGCCHDLGDMPWQDNAGPSPDHDSLW